MLTWRNMTWRDATWREYSIQATWCMSYKLRCVVCTLQSQILQKNKNKNKNKKKKNTFKMVENEYAFNSSGYLAGKITEIPNFHFKDF